MPLRMTIGLSDRPTLGRAPGDTDVGGVLANWTQLSAEGMKTGNNY